MRQGRAWRVVLGLLTIWSPVFTVWLVVWFVRSPLVSAALGRPEAAPPQLAPILVEGAVMVVLLVFTLAALAVTTGAYALHILKNPALTERARMVWSVINVTVGPFAMPFYWYAYFWRHPEAR